MADDVRIERDSLGEVRVPASALYGAQTQRAVENFPISGQGFGRAMIHALGVVKAAAARANAELGNLPAVVAEAIAEAADDVATGRWDDQFPVDVYQTGSGTSTNMNANEVVAALANRTLEDPDTRIHPNDHVNFGQSSNDVIPTTIHVACRVALEKDLIPALEQMAEAMEAKAREFDGVVKSGRTHLMDATPVRLGQEFGGYAAQLRKGIDRVRSASAELAELPLGGTATGTGINTHPEFAARAILRISAVTGLEFHEARNHFEAQGARDGLVQAHGALNTVAVTIFAGWPRDLPRGSTRSRSRRCSPGAPSCPGR